jgi:divalent metal cation (Fe/Co/Zn/Cd) transporter
MTTANTITRTVSVALLGDTLHNVADALTAVPLGIAFILGRRTATRRYTYAGVTSALGGRRRTDGFTSLAVLLGVGGVAIGWQWADPVVGLLITVAIGLVLKDAAREVYRRLMDAVDPALVDQVEATLRATSGVLGVGEVRLRWIGHQLRAECEIGVGSPPRPCTPNPITPSELPITNLSSLIDEPQGQVNHGARYDA